MYSTVRSERRKSIVGGRNRLLIWVGKHRAFLEIRTDDDDDDYDDDDDDDDVDDDNDDDDDEGDDDGDDDDDCGTNF